MLYLRDTCAEKFEKTTSSGVFLFSNCGMKKWRDDSRDDEKEKDLHTFQDPCFTAQGEPEAVDCSSVDCRYCRFALVVGFLPLQLPARILRTSGFGEKIGEKRLSPVLNQALEQFQGALGNVFPIEFPGHSMMQIVGRGGRLTTGR